LIASCKLIVEELEALEQEAKAEYLALAFPTAPRIERV
jgi:hypothetical protein